MKGSSRATHSGHLCVWFHEDIRCCLERIFGGIAARTSERKAMARKEETEYQLPMHFTEGMP